MEETDFFFFFCFEKLEETDLISLRITNYELCLYTKLNREAGIN